MPTQPHTPSQHHFIQAEQTLASLGALGPDEAERIVETLVALVHATLSVAASLASPPRAHDPRSDEQRFGQDFG